MFRISRYFFAIAVTFLLGYASAQIGQPPQTILGPLAEGGVVPAEDGWYVSADGFQVRIQQRGDLAFRIEGRGRLTEANTAFAAQTIAAASGLGPDVQAPVVRFFDERAGDFVGQGRVAVGLDAFVLTLEVTGEAPYAVDFSLAYARLEPAGLPPGRHALGPDDATFVIREFSDFQCPFCANYALQALPLIKDELLERGDVRFEYHHFPLQSIHPNAAPAAEAAECVASLFGSDAFWTFHDALFAQQDAWAQLGEPSPYFVDLAVEVGIGPEGLAECIGERRFAEVVAEDFRIASSQLNLRGTPSVFVNGFRVANFLELDAYLAMFDRIEAFAQEEAPYVEGIDGEDDAN